MKIGYSKVDITPPLGVELGGYGYFLNRRAEGILDSLYARAVMFIDGEKRLLLINCDLIHLTKPSVELVKHQLSKELGIAGENIMLLCIHNHTSPATGGSIGGGEPDEEYIAKLHEYLIYAGKTACRSIKEVSYSKQFVVPIEPIGYNRVNPQTPIDNSLHGMAFYFNEGKPLAFASHGCHPVTLGRIPQVSADYPGRVVKALMAGGYYGIFLNGFCGEIDPVLNSIAWGTGTEETINDYGQQIADVFLEEIEKASVMGNTTLDVFNIPFNLQIQKYDASALDSILEHYGKDKENNPAMYKVVELWASEMKSIIADGENAFTEKMVVQVFRIGDVILAGFPAEVFSKLGMIIKEALSGFNVMTLGCANDILRYIASEEDISNSGYAGFSSGFYYKKLPLVPGEGERMAEFVADTLKEKLT